MWPGSMNGYIEAVMAEVVERSLESLEEEAAGLLLNTVSSLHMSLDISLEF